MKKVWLWILLLPLSAFGQHIGFNGAGFFENYNSQTVQWLHQWEGPFTIRVPGGAISKFHDPYNVRSGWGMSEASVRHWFEQDGFDEDGQGLDKWLRKTAEQPDHSYLDDLIALQKEFPKMQVLYVLNVLNSTPEANMQAIRYLMQNGVHISGVEAGNEIYGKYGSFSEYIQDFEPIFEKLDKEFPGIKKGLVAGANLDRQQLVRWNNDLAAYTGDYDAVIIHYYYTARELGESYKMLDAKVKYVPGTYYDMLDKAFTSALASMNSQDLIGKGLDYAERQFPGKKIWITEWNTKPSDKLNNTLLNAAWQFSELQRHRNRVEYFLVHNGVSPDKYGLISRSNNKFDSEKSALIRRTGFWSMQLALAADKSKPLTKGKNEYIPAAQMSSYWFSNMGEAYQASITWNKDQFREVRIHYVAGDYLYSSGGYAGYMSKGSKPSYEINGVASVPFTGIIPANSFGYIEWIPK
jgi:hypothetical protein